MSDLIRYDEMCRAIDACYTVDEVKDIRDRALAFEHYARQAKNPEPERRACEIRLRAERKAGQLLKETDRAEGNRGPVSTGTTPPTLTDMGISRDQSSRWQKLADVPEDEFEATLAAPKKPSTNGIIREHRESEQKPMDPKALWVWGRLRDFERDGVLDTDPRMIVSEMTEGMQADVRRLAGPVMDWLSGVTDE